MWYKPTVMCYDGQEEPFPSPFNNDLVAEVSFSFPEREKPQLKLYASGDVLDQCKQIRTGQGVMLEYDGDSLRWVVPLEMAYEE